MKKKRDTQKSVQRLLDAAIDVFAEQGPQAATVDEICRRAELNKRMLYHYFGGKAQLYHKALEHMYEKLLALDISLGTMLLSVDKLIATIVRQYYTFLKDHRNFVRLICFENLNGGRTARKLKISAQKAPVVTALKLALEKGQTEGRFRRNVDVQKLLVSIMGLCFFYFSNQYTMREIVGDMAMTKPALDRQVKHVVDLVLHGIVNNGKTSKRRKSPARAKQR